MNDTLSLEDRCHVRTALFGSLAFVFTLLLSTVAWAGVNRPTARPPSLSAAAPAAPPGATEETSNESVGCGCAESCFAAN